MGGRGVRTSLSVNHGRFQKKAYLCTLANSIDFNVRNGTTAKVQKKTHPKHYWNQTENRELFLESLKQKLNIQTPSDWYKVSSEQITKHGGSGLLNLYGGSLSQLLQSTFPNEKWKPWLFEKPPRGFWTKTENRKMCLDWLAHELNIELQEDWYSVRSETAMSKGADGLLRMYGKSLITTLKSIYPQFEWKEWLFAQVPKNFWNEVTNQRRYFDWLAEQLDIQKKEDWYKVSTETIRQHRGELVLYMYGDSLHRVLQNVYPEEQWYEWLFEKVPSHFWDSMKNQKKCLEWLAEQLGIKNPHEWCGVSRQKIREMGGGGLLSRYGGSLSMALEVILPDHNWKELMRYSASQMRLHHLLQSIPSVNKELKTNYRHPQMIHQSDRTMELDFYIPSLSLAIEFQGAFHYSAGGFKVLQSQQWRDEEKRRACEKCGITLIEIPYWWDGTLASLVSSIQQIRPDVSFALPLALREQLVLEPQ